MDTMERESVSIWYSLSKHPGLGPKKLATIALAVKDRGLFGADLPTHGVSDLVELGLTPTLAQSVVDALG
ncbi:MAG: hypothetical protein ABR507_09410 [Actinomycetota bacterium]